MTRMVPGDPRSISEVNREEFPILRLRNLEKRYSLRSGRLGRVGQDQIHAVSGVDLDVMHGETLGLVGETGCGKSTLARLILRLVEPTHGSIEFAGRDITRLGRRELRSIRRDMQIVFQDPYSSLDPRRCVGDSIAEPFRIHRIVPRRSITDEVHELMSLVGLEARHYGRYPSQLSGGQLQRVGIARALALKPKLLILDEPVSSLDVSIQAQIINLLMDLQRELHLTCLFISHDLSVVRYVANRIAVMYSGRIVELGDSSLLTDQPRHPYTHALLSAVPIPDPDKADMVKRVALNGDPPSPTHPPEGCRFHPRCPRALSPLCALEDPTLTRGVHAYACHNPVPLPSAKKRTQEADPSVKAAGKNA